MSLQLEEQELLLREDVTDEVARYSGQLMLHKEVDANVSVLEVEMRARCDVHMSVGSSKSPLTP